MILDFPNNIRVRLAQLIFFYCPPDIAKSLPCWLSQFWKARRRQPTRQRLSNIRTQQTKNSGIIKFEFKQLRFHVAHPRIYARFAKKMDNSSQLIISLILVLPERLLFEDQSDLKRALLPFPVAIKVERNWGEPRILNLSWAHCLCKKGEIV